MQSRKLTEEEKLYYQDALNAGASKRSQESIEEEECHCYCVGDQADASDCPLHGK